MKAQTHRPWLPLLPFLCLLAALAWQLWLNPAHEERGASQERLDKASAPLRPGQTISQSFLCQHAGLKGIEVLLVVYNPPVQAPPSAKLSLTLERLDKPSPPITIALPAAGLKHNQKLRFTFPPLEDSAQAHYRFTLASDGDYGIGFWHTTNEAYAPGELRLNGQPAHGDLYFTTYYSYTLRQALAEAGRLLFSWAPGLGVLILCLFLPGLVLGSLFQAFSGLDAPSKLALGLGLSMSFWALLLLWISFLGGRFSPPWAWSILGLLAIGGGYRWHRRKGPLWQAAQPWPSLALLGILLLTLGARLLQVRELVVPAWVDSVHHTTLTQLLLDQGRLPSSGEPYFAAENLHYHMGFHVNAALLCWLGGLSAPRAVLLLGQVLNALAPLAAYALASWWTGQRWAGVGAALGVSVVSYLPAYYASWGRYTQLAGLILLPTVCILLARATNHPRRWPAAMLALSGLAFTHYRVFIFLILFIPCLLLWQAARSKGRQALRGLGTLTVLALGSTLLLFPWATRILRATARLQQIYGGWAAPQELDNAFPLGLLQTGWGKYFLWGAGLGMGWALLRRRWALLLIPLWVGLWLLLANLHLLGLADIWLITNPSVAIALWLPLAVLGGWLASDRLQSLGRLLKRWPPWRTLSPLWPSLFLCSTLAITGWGSWRMVDIINPLTILATPEDIKAIAWTKEHTPADALFLINTRPWQGAIHTGTDGGWWLPLLAKRQVTLPCILYQQGPPSYRQRINTLAQAVEQASSLDDPQLRELLSQWGISHVFVGSKGGRLLPKELDPSPYYSILYSSGPVRIYAFCPKGKEKAGQQTRR
ncbi:MAG: hypothetical protein J7M05_10715 [Anaerolineae bacterium]|nr:hypothetical protein [Anaerolineae bacterium]